jgi:hypothetical protein
MTLKEVQERVLELETLTLQEQAEITTELNSRGDIPRWHRTELETRLTYLAARVAVLSDVKKMLAEIVLESE